MILDFIINMLNALNSLLVKLLLQFTLIAVVVLVAIMIVNFYNGQYKVACMSGFCAVVLVYCKNL